MITLNEEHNIARVLENIRFRIRDIHFGEQQYRSLKLPVNMMKIYRGNLKTLVTMELCLPKIADFKSLDDKARS